MPSLDSVAKKGSGWQRFGVANAASFVKHAVSGASFSSRRIAVLNARQSSARLSCSKLACADLRAAEQSGLTVVCAVVAFQAWGAFGSALGTHG